MSGQFPDDVGWWSVKVNEGHPRRVVKGWSSDFGDGIHVGRRPDGVLVIADARAPFHLRGVPVAEAKVVWGPRMTKTDAIDSMHPAECALRLLLGVVDSEAQVHDETGSQANGFIRGERVTHIVTDCDGDTIGRGTSEIAAIMDTIESRFRWESSQREVAEAKIRAFGLALRGLLGDS